MCWRELERKVRGKGRAEERGNERKERLCVLEQSELEEVGHTWSWSEVSLKQMILHL